jgi:hypothetical protein
MATEKGYAMPLTVAKIEAFTSVFDCEILRKFPRLTSASNNPIWKTMNKKSI